MTALETKMSHILNNLALSNSMEFSWKGSGKEMNLLGFRILYFPLGTAPKVNVNWTFKIRLYVQWTSS